jgi:hypothetical protein
VVDRQDHARMQAALSVPVTKDRHHLDRRHAQHHDRERLAAHEREDAGLAEPELAGGCDGTDDEVDGRGEHR